MKIIEYLKNNSKNEATIEILDKLQDFMLRDYSKADSKFEICYKDGLSNIKLLHLLFYKEGYSIQERKKIYSNRKNQILSFFNSLNKKNNFNLQLMRRVFRKIEDYAYPIQFGIEFNDKKIEKFKIYFSNIDFLKDRRRAIILAKGLMKLLKIKDNLDSEKLLGEGIDSLGIDFLNNNTCNLKIYTFYHSKFSQDKVKKVVKNQFKKYKIRQTYLQSTFNKIGKIDYSEWGFLYRVTNQGTINSVKFWYRINPSVDLFFRLAKGPSLIVSYITCDETGCWHYLRDNGKPIDNLIFKEII